VASVALNLLAKAIVEVARRSVRQCCEAARRPITSICAAQTGIRTQRGR
jgi:hypothetical protein